MTASTLFDKMWPTSGHTHRTSNRTQKDRNLKAHYKSSPSHKPGLNERPTNKSGSTLYFASHRGHWKRTTAPCSTADRDVKTPRFGGSR